MYGIDFLVDLKLKTKLLKYIIWSDLAHSADSFCYTYGPFDFNLRSDIIKEKSYNF